MARQAHVLVSGIVQGVYFRLTMQQEADKCGATGWVRNLPDGRVEAVIQGDDAAVEALLDWCHRGPASGRVDSVDISDEAVSETFESFDVRD